jgi:putative heme-binding domain-containing protein
MPSLDHFMFSTRSLVAGLCCLSLVSASLARDTALGLRVPDGFEVTEFADSKLANDIFCLALDPKGRVLVSGRGYVRLLVDDDNDGKADRALDVADGPKNGAMGLLWEGSSLYVTGDGGLRRYRIKDDKADGPSELIRAMKTGGEHDAHAIKRGPDGWLYVLCGNNAGIDKSFAQLPTSPIKDPVAGCLLRFAPDLKKSEIVADGFRNAYDFDFNPDGEVFTYDSDNERCVSLPWYEGTRFYHVIPGGHHGWQSPQRAQTWRMPPYFCDVVAPVIDLGRGSPTGVACYRHVQFPEKYRGGGFVLDWTFGRVWFQALKRSGSTYTCQKEVFLESVGDNGFAPTALAVHPVTGDLYVAIGGRGTRGAVYRVRYPQGLKAVDPAAVAKLQPMPTSLDWQPTLRQDLVKQAAADDALERLRALTALRRHREQLDANAIRQAVQTNWGHADRYVRKATAELIATLPAEDRRLLLRRAESPREKLTLFRAGDGSDPTAAAADALLLLSEPDVTCELRLAAVRLLQRAVGGPPGPAAKGHVWEGYAPNPERFQSLKEDFQARVVRILDDVFPSGNADLDRELSRTLALFEDGSTVALAKVAAHLGAKSHPVEDIHYLIVLSRLKAERPAEVTRQVARALLELDRKLTEGKANRDRNWPLRIAELHAELARKDAKLNDALLADQDFGRPDHVLFAQAPGFDKRRATEVLLARAQKDNEYPWTPALVELVGVLPEEQALPVLRRLWDRGGLEESILPQLARQPQAADRDKFLHGLDSPQLGTIRLCIEALEKLPAKADGTAALALVRALRSLPDGREENKLRERIGAFLAKLTGQEKLGADKQAWTDWLAKAHPDLAKKLGGADGVDIEGWGQRLAKVDWSQGDAERGKAVYVKTSCSACHSGSQALGPDLHGVTGRFSRDDLFTALVQPSKDISPRYRTTLVATADGKVYQGMVIYEAVDSLILQTGPATTVRLTDQQIAERRFTQTSLMPAGLLDKLADRDIADLYAYLRSLRTGAD